MRTSFSFVQRVRLDRESRIDEKVRPMAVTEWCDEVTPANVCRWPKQNSHAHFLQSSPVLAIFPDTMTSSDSNPTNVRSTEKKIKGYVFHFTATVVG